jgi:stringent starvation protein B
MLPPKKDVARGLLLRGTVFVHLDPRADGVVVPPWLAREPQLVLQVGLDMVVPIPDLRIDDEGVSGTLSFSRAPFTCSVPWAAVFAVVGEDGRGMVWPDSMPAEIRAEVEREAGLAAPAPSEAETQDGPSEPLPVVDLSARRTHAYRGDPAVQASGSDEEAPSRRDPPQEKKPGRSGRDLPPYLRVVK